MVPEIQEKLRLTFDICQLNVFLFVMLHKYLLQNFDEWKDNLSVLNSFDLKYKHLVWEVFLSMKPHLLNLLA